MKQDKKFYLLNAKNPKPAKLNVSNATSENPIPMSGAVPKGPSEAGIVLCGFSWRNRFRSTEKLS